MGLFHFFHATENSKEDIEREKLCVANIKKGVSIRCGISEFIDCDDFTVAFAGSKDNMELMLEVHTQKYDGKKYLYASVDDEVSWQEWDFDSLEEFENCIITYIANRINRTVKTVIESDRKHFRIAAYYLNDQGDWVCMEDERSDRKWFCYLTHFLMEGGENVKTYRLE